MRRLALAKRNVALVRDLTDTMYNPASAPFVSHFSGTDLIVQHTEKLVCPTVESSQIVAGASSFRFKGDHRKHILIVQGEKEYETFRTLPQFAKNNLLSNFRVSHVFADPKNDHSLNNWEVIKGADLVLLSMRRRAIPQVQLDAIRSYVDSGKPLVTIRTSSHAFSLRDNQTPSETGVQWPEFDRDILGGHYHGHHGNKDGKVRSFVQVNKDTDHSTLKFLSREKIQTTSWLYKTSPLSEKAKPLITGMVENSDEPQPVAWTHQSPSGGRVFYTSLGHQDDFDSQFFQQLLLNAVHWSLELEPRQIESDEEKSQSSNSQEVPLKVASDLQLDLMVEDPTVANPLYLNFDERGRLWVDPHVRDLKVATDLEPG
jgi:type 1 glutamine amidotransferase